MNVAVNALVWASFLASWAFVIGYTILAPWWRTRMGRHMFTFGAMVAGLLTLIIVTALLGRNYPGRDYVRLACYAALAVMLWRHVWMLVSSQLKAPRDDRGKPPSDASSR